MSSDSSENGKIQLTFEEAMETLTGWDEIAIGKVSGISIEQMSGDQDRGVAPQALHLTRCVAAVLLGRDKDMKYAEAYREVMDWPQSRVQGMFAEPPDDVLPEEPDSESGKGESLPVPEPTT